MEPPPSATYSGHTFCQIPIQTLKFQPLLAAKNLVPRVAANKGPTVLIIPHFVTEPQTGLSTPKQ